MAKLVLKQSVKAHGPLVCQFCCMVHVVSLIKFQVNFKESAQDGPK